MFSSNNNINNKIETFFSQKNQAADQIINSKEEKINDQCSKLLLSNHTFRFRNSYFKLKKNLLRESKSFNNSNNNKNASITSLSNSKKFKNRIKNIYNKLKMIPNNKNFLNENEELIDSLLSEIELIKKYNNWKQCPINYDDNKNVNNSVFYSSLDSLKKPHFQQISKNSCLFDGNNKLSEIKEIKTTNTNKKEENYDNHKFFDSTGIKDYNYSYEKSRKYNSSLNRVSNDNKHLLSQNCKDKNLNKIINIKKNSLVIKKGNNLDYNLIQDIKEKEEEDSIVNLQLNKNSNNNALFMNKDEINSTSERLEDEKIKNINVYKSNCKINILKNLGSRNTSNISPNISKSKTNFTKIKKKIDEDINYDIESNNNELNNMINSYNIKNNIYGNKNKIKKLIHKQQKMGNILNIYSAKTSKNGSKFYAINKSTKKQNLKKNYSWSMGKNIPDIGLIGNDNNDFKIFDVDEYKIIMLRNDNRNSENFIRFINSLENKKYDKDKKISNLYDQKKYFNAKVMWISNKNKVMPPNNICDLYNI